MINKLKKKMLSKTGEKPEFIEKIPVELCVKEGNIITIRLKANGNPMPTFNWYHNGHLIRDRRFFIVKTFEEIGWTELTIMEIFKDDEGEIKCIAENQYGQTQTIGQINVERKC